MTLYNPVGPPLFSTNPIDQLYDDLKKMSSRENFSANLNKYALTLQLAYLHTFNGLDTLISNSSGDPSLDVFVSANNIGKSLGNINLSKEYISQILSRCVSPPDNCFELNKIFVFQSLINDLLERRNYLQSLGSVSSIRGWPPLGSVSSHGALPSHGGSPILPQQGGNLGSLQQGGSKQRSESVVPAIPISSLLSRDPVDFSSEFASIGLGPTLSSNDQPSTSRSGGPVLATDVLPDDGTENQAGSGSESSDLIPVLSKPSGLNLSLDKQSPSQQIFPEPNTIKVHTRGENRIGLGQRKPEPIKLSREILESLFGMRIREAATKLGISPTALKSACRKFGIEKWPYRQDFTTRLSRIQSRGAASSSSSINNRAAFQAASSSSEASLPAIFPSSSSGEAGAASSSSRTSFSTQDVATVASFSASEEAESASQAALSNSGTSSSSSGGARVSLSTSGTSSSSSGKAGAASQEEYSDTESSGSCVLYVDGEPFDGREYTVDLDWDLERPLPPILEESSTQQLAPRLHPLPPGKTRIGPRC